MLALLASLSKSNNCIDPGLNMGAAGCPFPFGIIIQEESCDELACGTGVTRGERGGEGLSKVMIEGLAG